MNIVEGGKLRPTSGVEVINLSLTEKEAASFGVRFDGPTSVADVARTLGMAPIITLEEVDFNRRPDDAAVNAGFQAPAVWAPTSRQRPVDDVEL